jgi:hypothetical protein
MTERESIETDPRFEPIRQELDAQLERMQRPESKAIVDAIFQAPFHLGSEAVKQFVTERVRE